MKLALREDKEKPILNIMLELNKVPKKIKRQTKKGDKKKTNLIDIYDVCNMKIGNFRPQSEITINWSHRNHKRKVRLKQR